MGAHGVRYTRVTKGPEVQQDNEEFRRDMSVGMYVLFM